MGQGRKGFHNPPMAGTLSQDFTYPLSSSTVRLVRAFGLLLFLPQAPCLSNYHWNVEPGPWSPHTATLSSTQHLSPTASTEKEKRSITLDSTAKRKVQRRVGGTILSSEKKHSDQGARCVQHITRWLKHLIS